MAKKDKDEGIQLHSELIVPAEVEVPVMYFEKMEFLPRLNVTVRKGTKWAGAYGPHRAQQVQQYDEDGYPVDTTGNFVRIEILDTVVGSFKELDDGGDMCGFLKLEHDWACRTSVSSLYQAMRRVYPATTPTTGDDFKWYEEVTVVFFRVDPAHVAPSAWERRRRSPNGLSTRR